MANSGINLDFTGLYKARTELEETGEYTITTENQKAHTEPINSNTEPHAITFTEAKQTYALEAYKEYQQNILKAHQIRSEILKGLDSGEPAEELLLKACEAISRMTGDKVFLDLVKRKI